MKIHKYRAEMLQEFSVICLTAGVHKLDCQNDKWWFETNGIRMCKPMRMKELGQFMRTLRINKLAGIEYKPEVYEPKRYWSRKKKAPIV